MPPPRRRFDEPGEDRSDSDEISYLLALLALPGMGPSRLDRIITAMGPEEAWRRLVSDPTAINLGLSGEASSRRLPVAEWSRAARMLDPTELRRRHTSAGLTILTPGTPGWPTRLIGDPEPPVLLVSSAPLPTGPSVAIVGTRRCSGYGRSVARDLGADLAAAGVHVVSGVAIGIDSAAQRAAVDASAATVVGVVASGHDVVYPPRNRALWGDLLRRGVLVSEWPLGTTPSPWRFPARNRIIAALADIVVVVESHEKGGSMYTVDAAEERGRPVLAVPGPVHNSASRGTNRLLSDGCAPVCDADDLLVLLDLTIPVAPALLVADDDGPTAALLDAMGWSALTLDDLAGRSGLALGELTRRLIGLEADGMVRSTGGWWERCR